MEPTIRKGEQGQVGNPEPDDAQPQDWIEQGLESPVVEGNLPEVREQLQIRGEAQHSEGFSNQPTEDGEAQITADLDFNQGELDDSTGDETSDQSIAEVVSIPIEQADATELANQPVLDNDDDVASIQPGEPAQTQPQLLLDEQVEPMITVSPSPPTESVTAQFPTDFLPLPSFEDVPTGPSPRRIALILSGGGARGAFQVGAEKYAREVKGYQWDIIAGVSVGAMNGAMLAMHRYHRLLEIWDSISNNQVFTGGFNLLALVKILFGAKSFYGNEPLKKLMQHEFEAGRVLDDLHVGAVSLTSGEYVQFTKESLELSKAILASASIPVVWPPVEISPDYPAMVDGGVRNITPVGDVLELEPDEIVIINCGNAQPPAAPAAAANLLSIGTRTLDIMQNEIFMNDMKEFLRINALVQEAGEQGVVLHHPKSGRPYKYYPCHVIEPDAELGGVLDFSQKSVQAALKMGVRRAREVLGRP